LNHLTVEVGNKKRGEKKKKTGEERQKQSAPDRNHPAHKKVLGTKLKQASKKKKRGGGRGRRGKTIWAQKGGGGGGGGRGVRPWGDHLRDPHPVHFLICKLPTEDGGRGKKREKRIHRAEGKKER